MPHQQQKLIEVALPLAAINEESRREKYLGAKRSTMHHWWARRPLVACRAALFASIVDDPSALPNEFPTEEEQEAERLRLHRLIEDLVDWDNHDSQEVLEKARFEMAKAISRRTEHGQPDNLGSPDVRKILSESAPPVLDPFAGAGPIPLEAQRLGLHASGADLNPIAVLITKSLVEIGPRFRGCPPINPKSRKQQSLSEGGWERADGIAKDVAYYGSRVREVADEALGDHYPEYEISEELVSKRPDLAEYEGDSLTPVAWIWARTVPCSNPGCQARPPLIKSLKLSSKRGNDAYAVPILNREEGVVDFEVRADGGDASDGTVSRGGAECIFCESPISFDHIKEMSQKREMGTRLVAVVADGDPGRICLPPNSEQRRAADLSRPKDVPTQELPDEALGFRVQPYGMNRFADLFSNRQLRAMAAFSDAVEKVSEEILDDAEAADWLGQAKRFSEGGDGAEAYRDVLKTYLTLLIDRAADYWCSLIAWDKTNAKSSHLFTRQTVPMVLDFSEANPFGGSVGDWDGMVDWISKCIRHLPAEREGRAFKADARELEWDEAPALVCTDPPYFDNIGYADLSDFFYVWSRPLLRDVFPETFETLLTPKSDELIADSSRFDSPTEAEEFFQEGLRESFGNLREIVDEDYPVTIFYAFKQMDHSDESGGSASTGWERMLEGLMAEDYEITGTWPIQTEMESRIRGIGSNALASSVLMVCRKRSEEAETTTRGEFLNELREELPDAIDDLQQGNVAPVDLAQAALGPGMSIYSQYRAILKADGTRMAVREALQAINEELNAILGSSDEGLDSDTEFAVAWFEEYGMESGPYGRAEVLFKAKGTSGSGIEAAGLAKASGGRVRLLKRHELDEEWDPREDARLTTWECTQHIIRILETEGEKEAAKLIARVPRGMADQARELAYRLYSICEREDWAEEALAYNNLVVEWPRLRELAHQHMDDWEGPLDRYTKED